MSLFGDLICPLSQTRTPVKRAGYPPPKSGYGVQKVFWSWRKTKTIIVHEFVFRGSGAFWVSGFQISVRWAQIKCKKEKKKRKRDPGTRIWIVLFPSRLSNDWAWIEHTSLDSYFCLIGNLTWATMYLNSIPFQCTQVSIIRAPTTMPWGASLFNTASRFL